MNELLKLRSQVRWVPAVAAGMLAIFASAACPAQGPSLRATAVRASFLPVTAQVDPGVGAPDPPSPGQANSPDIKDDLFAGTEKFAKGATDATEVNMDPDSLNMVRGPDAARAHRMILNVVRTYSYDKPGMYNMADVEEYRRKLTTGDWHCSIHSRDLKTGESTDICSRRRSPDLIENAIITVAPKSLTFIHSIRKANGQGGRLDLSGLPGAGFPIDMPMDLSMEGMGPALQAELQASTAALRAEMPALMQGFHFDMPAFDKQFRNYKFKLSPEMERLPGGTRNHLQHAPAPAPPSAPDALAVPPAPLAPAA